HHDQSGDVAAARVEFEEDEAGGQTSAAPERASGAHEEAQGEPEEVRARVAAIAAGADGHYERGQPAGRLSAAAVATADLLGGLYVSRHVARRAPDAVARLDSRPLEARPVQDSAHRHVRLDDRFDEVHAAARERRSGDEDAARDDDLADACDVDLLLLPVSAERPGALLDGEQPGRRRHPAFD